MAAIHLEGTNLTDAHLEGSVLSYAQLQGAALYEAHLESVDAFHAYFQVPKAANFRGVSFDSAPNLEQVIIANDRHVGARLLDIHWGDANITKIDWSPVHLLFDEDAVRFAYRAQLLQRIALRLQHNFIQYLFSLLLDLLAGYGYRPIRTLLWYILVVGSFALAYALFGHLPALPDALVYSLTSFHGRGFFPGLGKDTTLHNPLVVFASAEAVVGLFIEISFIATFTQRYFGK